MDSPTSMDRALMVLALATLLIALSACEGIDYKTARAREAAAQDELSAAREDLRRVLIDTSVADGPDGLKLVEELDRVGHEAAALILLDSLGANGWPSASSISEKADILTTLGFYAPALAAIEDARLSMPSWADSLVGTEGQVHLSQHDPRQFLFLDRMPRRAGASFALGAWSARRLLHERRFAEAARAYSELYLPPIKHGKFSPRAVGRQAVIRDWRRAAEGAGEPLLAQYLLRRLLPGANDHDLTRLLEQYSQVAPLEVLESTAAFSLRSRDSLRVHVRQRILLPADRQDPFVVPIPMPAGPITVDSLWLESSRSVVASSTVLQELVLVTLRPSMAPSRATEQVATVAIDARLPFPEASKPDHPWRRIWFRAYGPYNLSIEGDRASVVDLDVLGRAISEDNAISVDGGLVRVKLPSATAAQLVPIPFVSVQKLVYRVNADAMVLSLFLLLVLASQGAMARFSHWSTRLMIVLTIGAPALMVAALESEVEVRHALWEVTQFFGAASGFPQTLYAIGLFAVILTSLPISIRLERMCFSRLPDPVAVLNSNIMSFCAFGCAGFTWTWSYILWRDIRWDGATLGYGALAVLCTLMLLLLRGKKQLFYLVGTVSGYATSRYWRPPLLDTLTPILLFVMVAAWLVVLLVHLRDPQRRPPVGSGLIARLEADVIGFLDGHQGIVRAVGVLSGLLAFLVLVMSMAPSATRAP